MKKIVIKMRSYKKLINQDLLQLALIISLLKVDPNSYLGFNQNYGYDSGGGVILGEAWQPLPSFPSPSLKDPASLLERYQEDILEELNTLGSFNRFSLYGDIPVHLSAYLVDTDSNCQDSCEHTDSDSGISDTENVGSPCSTTDHPASPAPEEDKVGLEEDMVDRTGNDGLVDLGDLGEVLQDQVFEDEMMELDDGDTDLLEDDGTNIPFDGVEYGPEIPQELVQAGIPELDDHGAIQYELLHMDQQLLDLDYNIEDLDEAFIQMDEQIAKTIEDEQMDETVFGGDEAGFDGETMFDSSVATASAFRIPNPFDEWEREAYSAIPDLLLLDNILPEPTETEPEADILDTSLEEFDLDMLTTQEELMNEEEILRNDVMFSVARDSGDISALEDRKPNTNIHTDVYSPDAEVRGSSVEVEEDPLEVLNQLLGPDAIQEIIKEEDEDVEVMVEEEEIKDDLIAQVEIMKETGILEADVEIEQKEPEPVKMEIKSEEDIKVEVVEVDEEQGEVLHEEILDVVASDEFQSSLQQSGGACAQVNLECLYGRGRKGVPEFSLSYQPFFNWAGFHNDHASYSTPAKPIKAEPAVVTPRRRQRDESESSSGYYSNEDSRDSRSTRDEKLATKMGLPYTVAELINCPVERFNEILHNPNLSHQQVKVCKDIRRRGKNKVAAQNCRKRKLETIEELQVQVESVRRRRELLLAERERLEQERERWSSKLVKMEQFVLGGLGKDIAEFTIQVVDDRVEMTARVGGARRTGRSRN